MATGTQDAPLGRPFARLWATTGASNLADGVLLAGLPVLATTVTTDANQVAAVLTVFMTAMGLSSLPAGVVADRADGRRVLVATNLVRTTALVALLAAGLVGDVRLALLYAAAALCGLTEVVNDVTAETLVPTLVPSGRMSAAHGRLTATQAVMNDAVGAPVGAVLGAAGIAWALGAPAALYAVGALVATRLAHRPAPRDRARAPGRLRRDVRDGLAHLRRDPLLFRLSGASAALNLANTAFFAVLVLLVIGPMGLPRSAYGLLLATVALGGLLGGAVAEQVVDRIGQRGVLLLGPVSIGLAYGATCLVPRVDVAVVSLLAMSALGMVWNVTTRVLRQQRVPHRLLGRVSTSMRLVSLCATPVGGGLAGVVADTHGVRWVGAVTTAASVLALVLVLRARAVLLDEPTPAPAPADPAPRPRIDAGA